MARIIMVGVIVSWVVVLSVQFSSAGQNAQAFTPQFTPADCQFKIPQGETVECGYLTVPESRSIDPTSPDFRTIRLHVAHFYSHNPDAPPDPILYLVGGPGVSIFVEIDTSFFHFARLLDNRDVYVFDQRGVGYSEPALSCPEGVGGADFLGQQITECRDELVAQGINLAGYTTTESAADVADLRTVLGIEAWNVVGVSYGSHLALAVLRDNDAGIRSIILDSVFPLNFRDWSQAQSYIGISEEILATIFANCAADTACDAAYPDLANVYQTTFDELSATPVEGDDHFDFQYKVFQLFSHAETVQLVPHYIYTVYRDRNRLLDPPPIQDIYTEYEGMSLSVSCSGGLLGDAICRTWGVEVDRAAAERTIESEVPTLVLNGAYDLITPTFGAEHTAETLRNVTFFEIPFTTHGVIRSGGDCPRSIAFAFLDDPTQPPDASCIAAMQARFYIE